MVDVSSAVRDVEIVAGAMLLLGLVLMGRTVPKTGTWQSRLATLALGFGLSAFGAGSLGLAYLAMHIATPITVHVGFYKLMGTVVLANVAWYGWQLRRGNGQYRHAKFFTSVLAAFGAAILSLNLQLLLDNTLNHHAGNESMWISILEWAAIAWAVATTVAWVWDFLHKTPSPEPAAGDSNKADPAVLRPPVDDDDEAIDGAVVTTQWGATGR